MNVPPRPTTPPNVFDNAADNTEAMARAQRAGKTVGNGVFPGQPHGGNQRTTNKTRNGGGFNPSFNPSFNVSMAKNAPQNNGNTAGQAAPAGNRGGSVPGADFMSNEDIRKYCEHRRKKTRNEATELAMDADHLEAILRTIPDLGGNLGGSRARARRVSRWLKKAAAAEKNKQKYFAALYGTFEREYDSELRQIGKGRMQQKRGPGLAWH